MHTLSDVTRIDGDKYCVSQNDYRSTILNWKYLNNDTIHYPWILQKNISELKTTTNLF